MAAVVGEAAAAHVVAAIMVASYVVILSTMKKKKRKRYEIADIEFRMGELDLVNSMLDHESNNVHVGSGHCAYGGLRRESELLERDRMLELMVHQITEAPHKLFGAIHVTDKEFYYLYKYYDQARRLTGGIAHGSKFRTTSWGDNWPEFYMLMDYLSNGKELKQMESEYQFSFSSVQKTLHNSVAVYVSLLDTMTRDSRYPTPAQQEITIGYLHPALQALRISFIADTFKVSNVDSMDPYNRQLNYISNKGYGLSGLMIVLLNTLHWDGQGHIDFSNK